MKKERDTDCLKVLSYVIGGPILLPWLMYRFVIYLRKMSVGGDVVRTCTSCGASIPLVGIWRCQCGYTFRGHLLTSCPMCHSIPVLVRCSQCQVTTKLL